MGRRPPTHGYSRRVLAGLATLSVTALLAGCGGAVAQPSPDGAGTVWLCRPGAAADPCAGSLATTVIPASGARSTEPLAAATAPAFDCFYVYPTVSAQPTANANLEVQRAEITIAMAQAARFSQVCRVWAPMYRQRTVADLAKGLGGDPAADSVAYRSLLAGWRDYLANDNGGRPIILIGHSQGAAMLIRLIQNVIDPDAALRSRVVLAIIAGGNVTVPPGESVGGSFQHLPLCTAQGQSGCVIAYSSFPSQPPADADFGRPGQGVSLQSGQTATSGVQVACVNPAALGGGTGDLAPYYPTAESAPPSPAVTTPWVTYPGLYAAACRSSGGASWLQVTTLDAAGRPTVSQALGPAWGYHQDDINLALGNLVSDTAAAEAAYSAGG